MAGLHRHAGGAAGNAGDVAENIDMAIGFLGRRHHGQPLFLATDIQRAILGHAAVGGDFTHDLVAEFLLHVADHHRRAMGGEDPRGFGADAGRTAGNNRHLVLKPFAGLPHVGFLLRIGCCLTGLAHVGDTAREIQAQAPGHARPLFFQGS